MISYLRILLFFLLLCIFNFYIIHEHLLERVVSAVASSALSSYLCMFLFFFGKWFFYIYKNTLNEYGLIEGFLENIFLPTATFFIFGFPYAGFELFDSLFVISVFLGLLLTFDPARNLSKVIWDFRYNEFSTYPEDGVVSKEIVNKHQTQFFLAFIGTPLIGFMTKYLFI